ncbi:MAG TPA: crosslink repair DNA glycosylase YcaQ family protein [Actinomycetota bacterium]|nr:crosslink repair DNA glycosylase YcaQ family protein [Actinomycetota bacterium]
MPTPLRLSPTEARRLAVSKQRLAGPSWDGDLLGLIRDLGCLQLDPTNVVARTHLLVLWSRLGHFDRAALESLRWEERRLFEYWAHAASIVLTEDYPLFRPRMRHYATGTTGWPKAMRDWIRANATFKTYLLRKLRTEGPLRSRDIEDRSVVPWRSEGWTGGRNVGRMLDFLWAQGVVMVAGRTGTDRWWDLADRWLPEWTPREALSPSEVTRRAAERSLRALGVGTARHIREHFTRGYYRGLDGVLTKLTRQGRFVPAEVDGLRGQWFVHETDLPLVDRIRSGEWEGRTTLLSPFDNLICDRARTEALFGFRYRIEIYTPKTKREYGYFAMPILHEDRLIGRVDPALDRASGTLVVNAMHWEPGAPKRAYPAVRRVLEDLAGFVGAQRLRS